MTTITREQIKYTKYQIKVLKGYIKGKKIKARFKNPIGCEWTNATTPCWDWGTYEYKIEEEPPTPLELTISINDDGILNISNTNIENSKRLRKPRKFIEVIE